jgi:hypothetical protein
MRKFCGVVLVLPPIKLPCCKAAQVAHPLRRRIPKLALRNWLELLINVGAVVP